MSGKVQRLRICTTLASGTRDSGGSTKEGEEKWRCDEGKQHASARSRTFPR